MRKIRFNLAVSIFLIMSLLICSVILVAATFFGNGDPFSREDFGNRDNSGNSDPSSQDYIAKVIAKGATLCGESAPASRVVSIID